VTHDAHLLRATFDSASDLYQSARPDYPDPLYDTLIETTGIEAGSHLLEVGCASGKATLPLARRGFQITCVEIGHDLVATARRNLAEFSKVDVDEGAFETWRSPTNDRFDLVFAATAWHWIDPGARYHRAWELLRPEGHLAFWSATHVFPDDGDPFFLEIQEVYESIGEVLPNATRRPRPGELSDSRSEIVSSGLFDDIVVRQFDWETIYTADEYIALLNTFSNHIAMAEWKRDRLYTEIRSRLARRPDNRLRRHWGAALHIARRADRPTGT
jgi:SAM-dependent methyltransferase